MKTEQSPSFGGRDNLSLVIALVLFGLIVAVTPLAVDVAIGQGTNVVQNGTFDGLDGWTPNNSEWVTHSPDQDYAGDDGSAQFVTPGGAITQGTLATWLFSGEWRGREKCDRELNHKALRATGGQAHKLG